MPRIFVSYSHHDETWKDRIVSHLNVLQPEGLDVWEDRQIDAGDDWLPAIKAAINAADAALLLISANFLTSKFILGEEAPRLLQRREQDGLLVVPVIAKPCAWQKVSWLKPINARPKDGKPLSSMPEAEADQAMADIAAEIFDLTVTSPLPGAGKDYLEADIPDFTGRGDHVAKLLEVLRRDGGRAAISAIGGMGGVGKTTLALHVAHQLTGEFPDGRIQINLQGFSENPPLDPRDAMARIIHFFHPEARLPEDPQALAEYYRATLVGKRALLLLDNARDAAHAQPLLPKPPCGCIVTSRNAIALPGLETIDLDIMPPEQARQLLRGSVPVKRADAAQLDRLTQFCGYLPIALRAAAAYLTVYKDWTPAEYAQALEQERSDIFARLKIEGHDLDVKTVLGFSARRLAQDNPGLAQRWHQLAVFPNTFDRAAAAFVWETSDDDAHRALSRLLAQNLLLFDPALQRYRLHDLMRPLARDISALTGIPGDDSLLDQAALRHAEHYCKILANACELYLKGGEAILQGLGLADREWLNILAGHAWATLHMHKNSSAANLCNLYPQTEVSILDLRLPPREQIFWFESALDAARFGDNPWFEARHLNSLGFAYADLGETRRAIEYHEKALMIDRQIGNRRGEASELGNLGSVYVELGEAERAIAYHQQALMIDRELDNRRGIEKNLGNLGWVFVTLGKGRLALDYLEPALALDREIGDRRGEGIDLDSIGKAYAALGEYRRAIEYHKQALAIAREIGGRRSEGSALWNMALAHNQLGQREQALPLAEQALGIFKQIEDPCSEKIRRALAEWKTPTA